MQDIKKSITLANIDRSRSVLQSGQAGLVVVLMMVGLLIAGLSLASRTTQDLMLSTSQVESSRVFSAAEAGIEEALSSDFNFSGSQLSVDLNASYLEGASVNYKIDKHNVLDMFLFEGVAVKVDLTGVDAASNPALSIDWSADSNCAVDEPASVIVTVFFNDEGSVKARHFASSGCNRSDGFGMAVASSEPGLSFHQQFPLTSKDLFARIRPVYNDTKIKVEGVNFTLPTQYYSIKSRAENDYGDESRSVLVNRSLPTQPSIFDYVLFSGTDINK